MIIKKDRLKGIINEELNRLAETSNEGTQAANTTIEEFEKLNENQKLDFLEKFFFYLKENSNI